MSHLAVFTTWHPLAELALMLGGWNALLAAFVWRRHTVTLDRGDVDTTGAPVAPGIAQGLR